MKMLTVQQPWAWAIAHGGKDVENRTACWSYRGPLAIHAGTRWSDRGAEDERVAEAWGRALGLSVPCHPMSDPRGVLTEPPDPIPASCNLRVGELTAVGYLEDVHPDAGCCRPWGESAYDEHPTGRTRRDVYHLRLAEMVALPRRCFPMRGGQGLRDVPADVADLLMVFL